MSATDFAVHTDLMDHVTPSDAPVSACCVLSGEMLIDDVTPDDCEMTAG